MMTTNKLVVLMALLLAISTPTSAYWPTTLEENLVVASNPDVESWDCHAVPLTGGNTLVVFKEFPAPPGLGYQIIDRFGRKQYSESQSVAPGISNGYINPIKLISDEDNGTYVVWNLYASSPQGIHAQHLDSLGNRLWGDAGVQIFPTKSYDFDIRQDGEGGLLLAVAPDESIADWQDLYAQRVDYDGGLLWGPSGVLVSGIPTNDERVPKIAPDDNGGAYLIWEDGRLPDPYVDLFAQHLDSDGNRLWIDDRLVVENNYLYQLIADGEGYCLIQLLSASGPNTIIRMDADGHFLWEESNVSWNPGADIVLGEPGFFYLGFDWYNILYGQRMDLNGNTYWPSWPEYFGAVMFSNPRLDLFQQHRSFVYPYLTAIFSEEWGTTSDKLFIQSLDIDGNQMFGESGVHISSYENMFVYFNHLDAYHRDDGVTCVWEWQYEINTYRVYAKHVTPHGTLGGPFPIISTLTPHNIPIQIPAAGGSFTFDVALADSDSVGGLLDAWIDVILPDGTPFDVTLRSQLNLPPDGELIRSGITQLVPSGAPTGIYTYSLKAGYYPNSIWSSDSFQFEKLSSTSGSETTQVTGNFWLLSDFFDDLASDQQTNCELQTPNCQQLNVKASPNPFNPTTTINFDLSAASEVKLDIFNIRGCKVRAESLRPYNAGHHGFRFDGSNLPTGIYIYRLQADDISQTGKLVLIR